MRLTRYSVASVVLPARFAASAYPGTISSSGLSPTPAPAIGGPQGSPRSTPLPCTPPGSAGHRSGAGSPSTLPPHPPLPLPAGRLQKRLRAARRCWRVSGLESLLWPFRQRFSLAAAPDRSFPLRAMLDPAARAAAPKAPFPLPAPAAILSEGSVREGRISAKRARSGVVEVQWGRAQSGLRWETEGPRASHQQESPRHLRAQAAAL